uniref:MobA-like NTP transferase domain-containing protein n=1 Tax=viral metagenome TaxID=1070528 RepID=A0A6C0LP23_9ZZZZ
MKVFVLCGGIGSRLQDYSFPKPLNMIYGKPAISYTLQNLPACIHTIYFITSPHLKQFNFEQVVANQFKDRQCIFLPLSYFTRGPVESAWCGTRELFADDEPIVFLDNDVLFEFPPAFFETHGSAFLGYSIDNGTSEAFSFIQMNEGRVTMVKEKKRISNQFICGVYGFKSLKQFRDVAKKRLVVPSETELYLSSLFEDLVEQGDTVIGVRFSDTITHIGSLKELHNTIGRISKPLMRICFDLDNTLVTYPTVPGDYSTVKPIETMIQLVRKLHDEGHTIIIHTARRMATHKYNVGAVIRDIGRQTLDTLADFAIPYDELLFGKPIADMYIDDRAVNPYRNDMESMGLINYMCPETPINKLQNNKYNTIELDGDDVVKRGKMDHLAGEIYFYENIPHSSSISRFFPTYYSSIKSSGTAELRTEYIRGVPMYTLYKSELMTRYHMKTLFEILDYLHNTKGESVPSYDEVYANYITKLERRFSNKEIYCFPDAEKYHNLCLDRLKWYLKESSPPCIASYIHGDFWLSNILLDFKNNIKLIDMKGRLEEHLTTGGDIMYDYAKLYQSILGYDRILYNDSVSDGYQVQMKEYFFDEIRIRGISERALTVVTHSLIMGTLWAIETAEQRKKVWMWVTSLMDTAV